MACRNHVAPKIYRKLRSGEIYVQPLRSLEDNHSIRIPGGLIHHGVAVIFIPNATLAKRSTFFKATSAKSESRQAR